jgi:hypothetical protein
MICSKLFAVFIIGPQSLLDQPCSVRATLEQRPAIMYGTWAEWDGSPLAAPPRFYRDASPAAAAAVDGLAADARAVVSALCGALRVPMPKGIAAGPRAVLAVTCRGQIADTSTTLSALRTNAALERVEHPMCAAAGGGWLPDFSSAPLSEDLPCGLVPVRGVAEILGVETPWLDRVIGWAQRVTGREWLVGGRLAGRDVAWSDAPQRFGARTLQALLVAAPAAAAKVVQPLPAGGTVSGALQGPVPPCSSPFAGISIVPSRA